MGFYRVFFKMEYWTNFLIRLSHTKNLLLLVEFVISFNNFISG